MKVQCPPSHIFPSSGALAELCQASQRYSESINQQDAPVTMIELHTSDDAHTDGSFEYLNQAACPLPHFLPWDSTLVALPLGFMLLILALVCIFRGDAVDDFLAAHLGCCTSLEAKTPEMVAQLDATRREIVEMSRTMLLLYVVVATVYRYTCRDYVSMTFSVVFTVFLLLPSRRPNHGLLVKMFNLTCFVLWPVRVIMRSTAEAGFENSACPWPLAVGIPIFGSILHTSLSVHLRGTLAATCTAIMFEALHPDLVNCQGVGFTSVLATILSNFLIIVKLTWLQHNAGTDHSIISSHQMVYTVIPLCAFLLFQRLADYGYPMGGFEASFYDDTMLPAVVASVVLSFICLNQPHAMDHAFSKLGWCALAGSEDEELKQWRISRSRHLLMLLGCCGAAYHASHKSLVRMIILAAKTTLLVRGKPTRKQLASRWGLYCSIFSCHQVLLCVVGCDSPFANPIFLDPVDLILPFYGIITQRSLSGFLGHTLHLTASSYCYSQTNGAFVALATMWCTLSLCAKLNTHQRTSAWLERTQLQAQYQALDKFREVLDHQIKNIFMVSHAMTEEALGRLERIQDEFSATNSSENARDSFAHIILTLNQLIESLDSGSRQCYEQQALRGVSNNTYILDRQWVCIAQQLRKACNQCRLPEDLDHSLHVLVDMVLIRHIFMNAQSNAVKYGDRTGATPLQLRCRVQAPNDSTEGEGVLFIELQNGAGPDHHLLQAKCDSGGKISLEVMSDLKGRQRASHSSGLGIDIIGRCASLLAADVTWVVATDSTTFMLSVPVSFKMRTLSSSSSSPASSSSFVPIGPQNKESLSIQAVKTVNVANVAPENNAEAPQAKISRAVIIDDQLPCRIILSQILNQLGADHVTCLGDTAISVRNAAETIAAAALPPHIVIVDKNLNVPGLDKHNSDGLKLLETLSNDTRVCAMLVLCSSEVPHDWLAKHCHIFHVNKEMLLMQQKLQTSWTQFTSLRPLQGLRVCIVDDSNDSIRSLRYHLHSNGASVWCMVSGVEFLESGALHNFPFDVVVLDYSMPMLDGIETMNRIPHKAKERLEIIMFSTEDSMEKEFLSNGAEMYIRKTPLAPQQILNVCAQVLEQPRPEGVAHTESFAVHAVCPSKVIETSRHLDALIKTKDEISKCIQICTQLLETEQLEPSHVKDLQNEFHKIKGCASLAALMDVSKAAEAAEKMARQMSSGEQMPSNARSIALQGLNRIESVFT